MIYHIAEGEPQDEAVHIAVWLASHGLTTTFPVLLQEGLRGADELGPVRLFDLDPVWRDHSADFDLAQPLS